MPVLSRSNLLRRPLATIFVGSGLALGTLMPGVAAAQTDVVPALVPPLPAGMSDPTNAALLYARALRMIAPEDFRQIRDAQSGAEDAPSAERVAEILENTEGSLRAVVDASRLERCDWGVQYSKGPMALLDHAGPMRNLTHMMDAQTRALAARGDRQGAAEHAAAIFRMAEHMTQDRIMISSLVGASMSRVGANRVNEMLDAGQLDRTGAELVLSSVKRLRDARDFRMVEALTTEGWMASQWMRAAYTGPRAGALLVEGIGWMVEDGANALKGLELLDEAGLQPQFDGIERAYADLIKAWNATGNDAALEDVYAKVLNGEYGTLARAFVPNFSRSRAQTTESNAMLDALSKRLQQVK